MEYYITFEIDGRCVVKVDADNIEEAKRKADNAFMYAEIGDLECINRTIVTAEDTNGNYLDF